MAPGIKLDDKNAWDDSVLINSWDEALNEYKVSFKTFNYIKFKLTCFVEVLQHSGAGQAVGRRTQQGGIETVDRVCTTQIPTHTNDPNPGREHGDLIEEAETKSTLADQDEAGEAQANVRMRLAAAISSLAHWRDRNLPLPGTKATRKKHQRSHSMMGHLPPQCHRRSSAQVGIRLVTRVSNAQT